MELNITIKGGNTTSMRYKILHCIELYMDTYLDSDTKYCAYGQDGYHILVRETINKNLIAEVIYYK